MLAMILLAFSITATAQATRTWVSGVGDDANPCSRTAPCKTFAGAISKTATSGEIECLDPGGFGALTITKSITIDCDSGPGGVLVSGTNAITIAGGSMTVTLRSLNLQGIGQGVNGVSIVTSGTATVHLVDMNIYGFTQNGINVAASAQVFLTVEDTRIHDCANGIQTNTSSGLVSADLSRISIWSNSGNGISAQNGSRVQVHNSTIFANNVGVNQNTLSGSGSVVTVFECFFSTNGNAVQSIAGANMGVSKSVFSENSNGLNPNGGSIATSGDNVVFGGPPGLANGGPLTTI
jgi:hypothetical protein